MLFFPPLFPLNHGKVNCRHQTLLPQNIHHKASRNKIILLHNHDALLTAKNIHNHSIIYLIASRHSNFFQFFPKYLSFSWLRDISSLTKDWTQATKAKALSPNRWTAREFSPKMPFTAGVCIVVQWLSHVRFFATPWTAAPQASLSFTIPESSQTHIHWIDDASQPSQPLLPPSPPDLNLSQNQGIFQTCESRSNQLLSTAFVRCSL